MLPGLGSAIAGEGVVGIQFVGGATASKLGATSGNSTIPLNSGLTGGIASAAASGDFVIGVFATASVSDRTLAITDGSTAYTLIGSEVYIASTGISGVDVNLRVANKFITSDTDTTFGPTTDANDAGAMAVFVFRGVDTSSPLDVAVTTSSNVNGVIPNPPSISPVTPGAVVVSIGASAHREGVETFSSGDLSGFLSVGSDDFYDVTLGIGYGVNDASAFTFSGASDPDYSAAAMTIALRPA